MEETAAIRTRKLSKVFGTRKAVDKVSIEVPQGVFLSIFGPNGAGKTTLLRMLSTLTRPTDGSASLMGIDLREDPEAARGRIGLISHNAMLYPDLTAEQNLLLYAKLCGLADPQARVMELLEAVELKHRRLDVVRTFSRGMTQRLSIARAVARKPEIYLFDDSFSALDFKTDAAVRRALGQEAADATVIVVAQRIATVMHADEILVLDEGRLAGKGTHAELMESCEVYRQIAVSQLSKEELAHGTK